MILDPRAVDQQQVWDERAAQSYDSPGEGMFDPALLDDTTAFLAELAAEPDAAAGGGRALEFAIGTGRVAIPLHDRGVPVAGIELSRAMLARLREKVDDGAIPTVEGDMTTAVVSDGGTRQQFSLAYLVFNTISNVLSQAGQVEVFRNAARHLVPGGRFVIELWVPELRTLPPGQGGSVFVSEPGYLGIDTFDTVNQHLVSHHVRFDEGTEASIFRSPHRYIWPSELDLMAQLAGFELEARYADWTRAPFSAESTSHVSVYRKV